MTATHKLRMLGTLRTAALAGAVILGLVGSASAAPIVPSPTIVSGNITFNNFVCTSATTLCSVLQVNPYTSVSPPDATTGDFGIQITGNLTALLGQTLDVQLRYDAHIVGGLFHDASLFYQGTTVTSITENIFNIDTGHSIGQLVVTNPPPVFTDDIILSENATNIRVLKDIAFACPTTASTTATCSTQALISIIDQNFSQVPEPATLALFGSALVGLGLVGRRRNRRNPV